jgi:hypothetical protein
MAVIKIVPMPGAVGDKGDEGAIGPRGQQGETGLQGPAGADALWSYNGQYNPGAGYAVGDVVTYQGQLWYRKNSNGGNVGDTPSQGLFWDLLAAKGEDWTSQTSNGMWDTNIKAQSGISGGYSIGLNFPSMGTYTKMGNVVNFYFTYNLSDEFMGQAYPVSYNSSSDSNFSFKLPFPIAQSIHGVASSFNGYDYAMNNYVFTGRFFGRVDSSLPAGEFNQPDEEGWTEVHGIGFTHEDPNNRQSYVILSSQDFEDINTNSKRWRNMSHSWPFDFSGTTGHRYFQLQISGTYISE